jgi:hypothetical protein
MTKYDIEGSAKLVNYCDNAFGIGNLNDGTKYICQLKYRSTSDGETVKIFKIDDTDYLHLVDYGYKNISDLEFTAIENKSKKDYTDLITDIIGSKSMNYTDLVYELKNVTGKSEIRCKQIVKELSDSGKIYKSDDKKYLLVTSDNDEPAF